MKSLLTVTAIIEGATGLALAIVPSLVATSLLGTSHMDPSAAIIARLAGAALITIAIACWLSRTEPQSSIMVKAMVAYNIFSLSLLIYATLIEGIVGQGLWPAVILHFGLLAWCFSTLWKRVK